MIPVKILCGCGQKYAFDVEPIGSRIAHAVQCPACGSDGTLAANQIIAEHLAVNAAPASDLRIGGQQRPATVPLPPRIPAAAAPESNCSEGKVRNKWFILILSGAVVSLLVLAGAVMFASSHHRKPDPALPVAELPAGLPQTLVELNGWYVEPPVGQNAADLYLKGLGAMQLANIDALPFSSKAKLPALGSPIPSVMKSNLAAFVKANQAALQLFTQGTKYDHCRYPVDLTLGFDALFPHAKKLSNANRVLELTAIYHAESNQGELAAKYVLVCLALANSLLEEPAVLAQLPRTWGVANAVEALERTANRTLLPAEALSELAKVFQDLESSEARGEGFNRALAGERAMDLAALADPQQLLFALSAPDLNMPADRRSKIIARLEKSETLTKDREFFEASFRRLQTARQAPFPARLKADALGRQLANEALDKKLFVLDLLLPSLGRRTVAEAECLAWLRLGSTAVALEQFRAAHGNRYPATLSELTPDYLSITPADPFDGRPLRYRKNSIGYVLHSIGPDLKDGSWARKNGRNGDLVFSVITPMSGGR